MQTLTTERLDLVPLEIDRDLADLHLLHRDPEVNRYGSCTADLDQSGTHAWLDGNFGDNGGWTWVVRIRPSQTAVGVLGVFSDQGTSIRGLSWHLNRDFWGRGVMSEAAKPVVDHLLSQPSITGVEAWIDCRNVRSIGVARRAGLDQVGRLMRVYDTDEAQSVVMARAATPRDPAVIGLQSVLPVEDLERTLTLLVDVLGLHVRFRVDDHLVRVGLTEWSNGTGINVVAEAGPATTIGLDLGSAVDPVHERVVAAGFRVEGPPEDRPWYRREFMITLPEGHQLRISGPLRPTGHS